MLLAGIGIFVSQKMNAEVLSVNSSVNNSGKSSKVNIVKVLLYFAILVNAAILTMPLLEKEIIHFPAGYLAILPIVMSGILWKMLSSGRETVWSSSTGISRFVLDIHGLLFLGIFQTIVLLQIADSILSQVLQESNYSSLVSIIILAGIFTLVGGLEIVIYTTLFVGGIFAAGISLALLVPALVNSSTVKLFTNIFFTADAHTLSLNGPTGTSLAVALSGCIVILVSMALMIFGTYSTMSKVYVTISAQSRKKMLRAIFIGLIGIVFLLVSYISLFAPQGQVSVVPGDIAHTFFAVCSIIVLTGVLVITFQQFGSLASTRIAHRKGANSGDEEQVLVQKLSTLAVVLLAVLLISFVKAAQHSVMVYFIEFVVFFSTPIAVSFLLFSILKSESFDGVSIAVLLGEAAAGMEFVFRQTLIFTADNLYSFGLDITVITATISLLTAMVIWLKNVKKQSHSNQMLETQQNIKQHAVNQLNH